MFEILKQFFIDNAVFTALFALDIVGIIGVVAAMAVVKIRSLGKIDDSISKRKASSKKS